jgi:hypothetical protein
MKAGAKTKKSPPRRRYGKKYLQDILPFIHTFKTLRPAQRVILLAHLDDKSCNLLCECCANVLHNSKIPTAKRKRLSKALLPHKAALRQLVHPSGSLTAKRKKLYQLGGGPLSLILGTALPLLVDLLRKK